MGMDDSFSHTATFLTFLKNSFNTMCMFFFFPHIASLHHCLCVSHLCIKMWIGFSWYFLPPQTEVGPQVFFLCCFVVVVFFFVWNAAEELGKVVINCLFVHLLWCRLWNLMKAMVGFFIRPLCFQQVLTAENYTFTFFWPFFYLSAFSLLFFHLPPSLQFFSRFALPPVLAPVCRALSPSFFSVSCSETVEIKSILQCP